MRAVARFIADSRGKGIDLRCPVCESRSLFPLGFEVSPEYDTETGDQSEYPVFMTIPKALVGCGDCNHVIHFAWLPIQERYYE